MDAADVAQIASAAFTALAALAALLTVRQARHETRIAREALEAETQPLITDVPRGLFTEEIEWHNSDGATSMKRRDRSELSVGTSGPQELVEALEARGLPAVAVWVRGHQSEPLDASPRAMAADRHMLARLPDGPFVDISRRQFDAKAAHPRYYWSESELASDWREIDDGPTNGRLEDEDWRGLD